jgi:serine/threonine protein kinase
MMLVAGSKLGPYEILSAIGAGGMGEVYRAHDGRLNRDVAIKVLPEVFAADPDRMARLRRSFRFPAFQFGEQLHVAVKAGRTPCEVLAD